MKFVSWPAAFASLLVLGALAGCNSDSSFVPVVPTAQAQYRAYGDSITHGYFLSDPLHQAYPTLVAEFENVTFANNAIDGDEACDIPTRQLFPNNDSPTLETHPTYSVLIGTNDVDRPDDLAYEPIFALCHRATVSWVAVPAEYKVLAGGSGASTTGRGSLDTANNWNAWTTAGQGSSVSFKITTSSKGPIYAWPLIDDNSDGTYTYALDGTVIGSSQMRTTPKLATKNGSTQSLGFIRIDKVAAGTHVVTFTQTSAGSDGISIVGIGTPAGTASGTLPTVLAGTIPYQNRPSGKYKCVPGEPVCLAFIKDIEDNVAMFTADGLDLKIFDTRKYMHGTPAEMADPLHPNALGQKEIGYSVEAAWPSAL